MKNKDCIDKVEGRFSLFAQLSLTGDFSYYKMFVDKIMDKQDISTIDDRRREAYTVMMNGMLPMIGLYCRLDLLKSSKYNCQWIYQLNQGLPFLTIVFAAYPSILFDFKKFANNKLGFSNKNRQNFHVSWQSRLDFLYNLCYSSQFHIALQQFWHARVTKSTLKS